MNRIGIVILNWNGKKLLETFLPSVVAHSKREWADVIIADNASSDDSIAFLKKEYPDIQVIQLDKNYGFADGYNKALEQLSHSYFVLLNSDVEVTENWLDPIYNHLEKDPSIAAAQPKIKAYHNKTEFEYAGASGGFIDYLGYPFCRGRILDQIESDRNQYNSELDIFWASGASLFIRADVYKKSGGLDGDFFAHMEEIDLCWRIKNQGYRIISEPKSTVYHVGGATLPNHSSKKLYLNFRNNLFMLHKNLPENKFCSILLKRMVLDGIAAMKFLLSGEFSNFGAVFKAHLSYYSMFSKMREKRTKMIPFVTKTDHKEMYKNSIIFDFYLRKKKHFSDITF
ncbi:glycosyltransferase [Labilibaculum sp. A4]|uniref:glycosyltransferase family 2 protein n=1 Tax=Labilibaculum euxinus TaxID=2686357 RepID=UPI000F61C873|nr:glycosyltransferase family 2 protein [Labilibaculum euxinus]MDQ1769579.1 glycosyltransferase family 2 protein [Labilibaculum euxinus]MWN75104.1 glycosyltransferase [Labilibaculum euxinus]